MRRRCRSLLAVAAAACAVGALADLPAVQAVDDVACSAMASPAYHRLNPTTGAQLVTASQVEADNAIEYGFTEDLGVLAEVSTAPGADLLAVHRIYNRLSKDFAYLTNDAEIDVAAKLYGYVDQGIVFYAASAAHDCTVPVSRYLRAFSHRLSPGGNSDGLAANGWAYEMVAFHAGSADPVPVRPQPETQPPANPPDNGSTFSFAVLPDTQNETAPGDPRMRERVAWLLANREPLDVRWILHSGDVHNWPTPPNNVQFAAMSEWFSPLDRANFPYVFTAGNHDTGAVCPGGSACPGANTNLALRDTSVWNAFYTPARFGLEGTFDGKSENGWRTFSAGGKSWLILSLELYPRSSVIEWAKQVVATHPSHNVIVLTHMFTEADGSISTSNGGYGATSPATLWDALDDYPNVVMTFSGHVGSAANTSLIAKDGHPVAVYLQAFHDQALNPTRIVNVDTATGTITTSIIANYNRMTGQNVQYEYTQFRQTTSGMRFVG